LKLSTFFRSSLTLDATADISLAEEIALQRLYLDIDKGSVSAPAQSRVRYPGGTRKPRNCLPHLQPIVENVIKHAVSQKRDKVELRIAAREAGRAASRSKSATPNGRPAQSGQ